MVKFKHTTTAFQHSFGASVVGASASGCYYWMILAYHSYIGIGQNKKKLKNYVFCVLKKTMEIIKFPVMVTVSVHCSHLKQQNFSVICKIFCLHCILLFQIIPPHLRDHCKHLRILANISISELY